MRKHLVPAALLCGLAACADVPSSLAPPAQSIDVPSAPSFARSDPIPGEYIVRFKDTERDVDARIRSVVALEGAPVLYTYRTAIKGLAVKLTAGQLAELQLDPNVISIQQNQTVSISTTQTSATWGLDRIDQRSLPLSTTYTYVPDGTGVTVYIIDTGINFSHSEYTGRAFFGVDEISPSGGAVDCNGHGSHVSGTVGGTTYGVAKNVRLVAVRVLGCSGSGSSAGVIAGIDWVTANRTLPAVANMSLGGGIDPATDAAVQNSIASGVTYAVAAGNSTANACNSSPARAPNAITVGATAINDGFASFSNFGSCVDINAPGVNITSAWLGTGTNTISGTSMASPHVAGAAALVLQTNPSATPAQVTSALISNATSGVITSVPAGTVNLLLFTGFLNAAQPPVANFTFTCTGLACNFDASSSTALAAATYSWAFGDATTGAGKTTSHSYAANGTYSVTLTVTDANGTSSKTQTVTVSVNQAPVARFTANCVGQANPNQCAFDASTSTDDAGIVSYKWDWGNGRTETRTGPTARNTWVPGTYTVTLTVTDAGGLTNSTSQQITVPVPPTNQPPTASITAPTNGASFVQGASVSFAGSGSDPEDGALTGASLVWSSSRDGQIGTGTSFSKSNLSVGSHTITLTAKDAQGATGTATISITITATPNQSPTATITAPSSGASFVQGASVSFAGSGSDPEDGVLTGASLVWTSSRDGQIGTGTSFSKTNLSVGTHTIILTAKDAQNATGTATVSITITAAPSNQPPVANFTFNCVGLAFPHQCAFDASSSSDDVGVTSYRWDWGNGRIETKLSATTKNTWASAGTFNVTLTVTDAGGLTNSITRAVAVP